MEVNSLALEAERALLEIFCSQKKLNDWISNESAQTMTENLFAKLELMMVTLKEMKIKLNLKKKKKKKKIV